MKLMQDEEKLRASWGQFVFIMRMIGIPLDVANIRSSNKLHYCCFIGLGLAAIFLNLTVNLTILVLTFTKRPETATGLYWNQVLNDVNVSSVLIMTHLGLLIFVAPNWKDLIAILRRIEQLNLFLRDDFKEFRRTVLCGKWTLVLMVNKLNKTMKYKNLALSHTI